MKKYNLIVIGSGCGMNIVAEAINHDMKVALVDKGPLGGTCPNTGCIPSKMLIHTADRVVEIEEAARVGIKAKVQAIDFNFIMKRMRNFVEGNRTHMKQEITQSDGPDYYEGEGYFIADKTIEVNGERIEGDKIVVASGSRLLIPPLKGLDSVNYLTNESLLQLKELPTSLIIIGGGYIAVEYGHFFAAMGTKVTILEMADRLVLSEEPEVAHLLQEELGKRMEIHTKAQVQRVLKNTNGLVVMAGGEDESTQTKYTAKSILIAVGRRSNADLLRVENAGIEVDRRSWIRVNDYLETSHQNIYAVGDANGQQMFTHVANEEAMVVANNVVHGHRLKMDYSAIPHAVYSHPQIASVGMTEEVARKEHKVLVGRAGYIEVAQGEAMMEKKGFAKAIVDAETNKILGFHIIGPYAPILIQEVTNNMASGGDINDIGRGIHIHPSITELIPRVFAELE